MNSAGAHSFTMHPKIRAIALSRLFEDLDRLK